jgi:hypothetical protein
MRDIIIRTGLEGARFFNKTLVEAADEMIKGDTRKKLKELFDTSVITEDKFNNIKLMIDSPDLENFYLAESIIEVIIKNQRNGTKIHSRKP